MDQVKKVIRRATHAGSWYSGEPKQLGQDLLQFLENASPTIPENARLKAIIGPHAGFRFSGPTAGWAYKNIDPSLYERVVLLGPSHKVGFDFVAMTGATEWETPVGNLPIDQETIKQLDASMGGNMFGQIDLKYEENEHSLEMHIPLIRQVFHSTPIKLVPLMVGQVPREKLPEVGAVLAPLFMDEKTLFVVSSDFCHWGRRFNFSPVEKIDDKVQISKSIEKMDREGMTLIEGGKLEKFQEYLDRTKNTICGRNPIQVLMATIEEVEKKGVKVETKFVRYAQSGEIIDDFDDSSVSYASSYSVIKPS